MRRLWLGMAVALALAVGAVPLLLGACCAPANATGLGTVWFVNDFAQYESAMRQGASQPGWLIFDAFTAEPHAPAFMFPLYVAIGKLAATLHVEPMGIERVVEVIARAMLVVALWRFCRAFARGLAAARWAFALALFGSGLELLGAVLGTYAGNWSYELNGFGLLLAAPHVPLAMAATLELARDGLRPRADAPPWWLLKTAALSATIALLHPFHAPVLLGAMLVVGVTGWRAGRGVLSLAGPLTASVAALPVLWPTITTFSLDPFWLTTYSVQNQLPSPMPHELVIDLGATLLLALAGAVWLRGRVAPFGLVVWLLLALIAMYLPVPYQRRLSFGLQPAMAVLAANTLVTVAARLRPSRAAILRLGVAGVAASGTTLLLASIVISGLSDRPLTVYRATRDLDTAAAWLGQQAQPGDVILADWDAANYLAARTPARVFGGHPVATLHPDQKQFAIATVFAHAASSQLVAHSLGVQWLVFGPAEADLVGPPGPAFTAGAVRVYRVAEGQGG